MYIYTHVARVAPMVLTLHWKNSKTDQPQQWKPPTSYGIHGLYGHHEPHNQNWLLSFTLPKWLRPDDPLAVWACLCYHLSEASQAVQGDLFQLECGEQSQRTNIQVLNEFNQHVSSMGLLLVSCFIQCLTFIKLKYSKYLKPDDGVTWRSITISGLKIQRFGSTSRFRGMWLGS